MLKLKKVELQGFKSFCDRTELRFSGNGITAVVGPNGCGKSNLSDAITWVLGEQSARSLRGARMEDVIFAGTGNRKPVGMASVTMVLVDPVPQVASVETEAGNSSHKPSEVTITRRLFRSGESEYLIDGRHARLRDIQDIFMGSGLGPESYAIIEQGRIGQILSSKPYDRRAVIEEAAGITRYKARKRLAEARLESAKQNLSRVFDILEEVSRQVNSLKRQAAKAKRYAEWKQDLDSRLRQLLNARFHRLDQEAQDAIASLEESSAWLRQLNGQVTGSEQEQARLRGICERLEADLAVTRKQLGELHLELTRAKGKLDAQVRETATLEQRTVRGEEELRHLESRLHEAQQEHGALSESTTALAQDMAEGRAAIAHKEQLRNDLQSKVREQERVVEASRSLILRLLGESSTLKNQLAKMDEYLASVDREAVRIRGEAETTRQEVERLAKARQKASEALALQQKGLETVAGERQTAEQTLRTKREQAAQLRIAIEKLQGECSRLKARKESLEDVISHHSYTTDSVKRIFAAVEKGHIAGFRPLGVLADFVEVDPALERAAEEFLHDELAFVVVKSWEEAEQGMQMFKPANSAASEGRATFLVEQGQPASIAPEENTPALPRLSSYLRFSNEFGAQDSTLLPRLSRCFLAPDAATARRYAAEYPNLYFLLNDGQCYHGRSLSGGNKKTSGPLALKREMRDLSRELEEQSRQFAAKGTQAESLAAQIQQLEHHIDGLRGKQQAHEKDALALSHELRKLTEEAGRAQSRISVSQLDLERLDRERERSVQQRERSLLAIAEKGRERTEQETSLEANRQHAETAAAEAARVREEHSTLRANLAAVEERHRASSMALNRLQQGIREMEERRQNLRQEIDRLGGNRTRLLAENIELERRILVLGEDAQRVEGAAAQLGREDARYRQDLQTGEQTLKNLRQDLERAHRKRSETEVELVRRQSELKFLEETSQRELKCSLAGLQQPGEDLADLDMAAVERSYQELQSRIESLGPINPQAMEEFEEAQQRQDFLTSQRQDLLDSIQDTEKAIQEIDAVSRHRFQEAFTAINQNFKLAFQTLFDGGSGEMRLTDESNTTESGIDIIASPPGKKLQNVLLLSGGEKSMAAMALLMAVFKFQPSPFCVLDEVDAPLDEANIGRLAKLLQEMAVDTQFIIITHSKKTMESAQAMYGVTMQEAGVSKLVSVRLHSMDSAQPAA